MNERIVFHVDMNAFFAAVEQQYNPGLRGRPIVVCGNPKQRTVVAACSYEAKAYGIQNGMSIFEAKQLCPSVILVGGDPEKYVDVAQRIFAILVDFTPDVEIFSIDEAFMDMTRTCRWSDGNPEASARLIKQQIQQAYGLTCSIGIGPNKLIAKLASNLQKPDGLVVVRASEIPPLMERLPVGSLCGIGRKLTVLLNDMGITTCADLGRSSEAWLIAKFGLIGCYLKRMGQGLDDSPVMSFNVQAPVKSMGHAYTLPRDTARKEEIQGTLLRLSEQVARRLRADRYQGRTIGLTIRYEDFATILRHETMVYPTDHGLRIYQAASRLFQQYCEPLLQRVRLVGVGISGLVKQERQLSFLDEDGRLERLDRCLDRINDRFGELTIIRASAYIPLVRKSHGFLLHTRQHHRGLMVE